ncbi:amidase [Pseudarthrobacter sp. 1C304]|uniref:amidase n=1 Tax=Pseudarthrobacter sp. 1C304 TaxID=3457438 RepID=UPI003FD5E09B
MTRPLLAALNAGLADATAIADAVRAGTRTAADVMAEARAASAGAASLNAFITEDWDAAERAAAELDRRRGAGELLGPLAGVPFSVKDVIAVAGLPVTAASAAFAGTMATTTAPAVQRLLDADAVLLGKTNCPEFAFGMTCDSPVLGRTANPRFSGATPGGSSGGEAASLAAGISALGVGTDFGGSVRWPAQCVGITALRPGLGTVSGDGQVPGAGGDLGANGSIPASGTGMQGEFQTIGPMARSVRDLRTAYLVMSGGSDAGTAAAYPGTGGLRIAWTDGSALGPVRREVTDLMERLAGLLAAAGHAVHHSPDLFADCLPTYNTLRAVDPMVDHAAAVAGREDQVTAANLRTIRASFAAPQEEVQRAWRDARAAQAAAVGNIAAFDVVLLPVAGGPASDPDGLLEIDGRTVEGWEIMGHCRAVTLTGCPAVSLPVALSAEGWPLSVQVVASPGGELAALDFAAELETLGL